MQLLHAVPLPRGSWGGAGRRGVTETWRICPNLCWPQRCPSEAPQAWAVPQGRAPPPWPHGVPTGLSAERRDGGLSACPGAKGGPSAPSPMAFFPHVLEVLLDRARSGAAGRRHRRRHVPPDWRAGRPAGCPCTTANPRWVEAGFWGTLFKSSFAALNIKLFLPPPPPPIYKLEYFPSAGSLCSKKGWSAFLAAAVLLSHPKSPAAHLGTVR